MIRIFGNYSLKNLNTFGIDAKAKNFASFESIESLHDIFQEIELDNENIMILGGGSNVLFVSDYDGMILKNEIRGIEVESRDNENIILSVGAGEFWDDVVNYAVQNKFYGIENLSLIPGSAGAAPIQNIGAYGVELKDVFHSLEGYFISNFEKREFDKNECKFGYRDSIFKKELKGKFVITKIKLQLSTTREANINYKTLQEYFVERNIINPNIEQIREAVISIRKSKLPEPSLLGNAGSFFKNPKVTTQKLEELKSKYPAISFFPFDENNFKIAAGWLIEKCGFKGKRVGDVGTHKDQALVIVNYGGATGQEIVNYARDIQTKVNDEFGILLEPEVNIINKNQRELL